MPTRKRILGAALLGMSGDEAVHSLLDVMAARQPYTDDHAHACTSTRR